MITAEKITTITTTSTATASTTTGATKGATGNMVVTYASVGVIGGLITILLMATGVYCACRSQTSNEQVQSFSQKSSSFIK